MSLASFEQSTQRDIKSPIQFVAEGITPATYGVTPENPAFKQAFYDAAIIDNVTPSTVMRHQVGSPDREGVSIARLAQDLAIRGKMRSADEALMYWAMSLPNDAVGSPDESRTFMFSEDIGGVTKWNIYKGVKISGANLTIPNTGFITAELLGSYRSFSEITPTAVAALTGTGSRITASSGPPLNHVGTLFTYNGTVYAFRTLTLSVAFDMAPVDSSGEIVDLFKRPTMRRITGTIAVFKKNSALQADARAQTPRNVTIKINPTITVTLTGFRFRPSGEERTSEVSDSVIESKSFEADGLVIT